MKNKIKLLAILVLLSCTQSSKEDEYYSFLIDKNYECTYWYSEQSKSVYEFCKSDTTFEEYFLKVDYLYFTPLESSDFISNNSIWSLSGDTIFFDKSYDFYVNILSLNSDELIIKPRNERYGNKLKYKRIKNKNMIIKKKLYIPHLIMTE